MTIIQQNAILPYSCQKIFNLLNDIESYPLFMDGCLNAEIIEQSEGQVSAKLDLGKGGVKCSFSTLNSLSAPHSMKMQLLDGPFKKFSSHWKFTPLGEDACKAALYMEFEFASGLIDSVLKRIFKASCQNLVNSVCKRADILYAGGK